MVLARDQNALAQEFFSVLHLDDDLARDWKPPPGLLDGRDQLPGGPGRTLFSQSGRERWF
jgi:hypothetical protein